MSKKNKNVKEINVADLQPDELNALKSVVLEFLEKIGNVDNEIELLKEDRKSLISEYEEKLDVKTLTAALKVLKIQRGVAHRDSFDAFMEVLTDPVKNTTFDV